MKPWYKSPHTIRLPDTFPEGEEYYGFWTWDRIFFGLLVASVGSLITLFFGPYWFEHLWHTGSIVCGFAWSFLLMCKSKVPWQERFGMWLFGAALIGAIIYLALIIYGIQAASA
ncbi:MAG: hypothetical protein WAP74_03610 [Patescibacteria group bacterium]